MIEKKKKPKNTMRFATAVMNFRMNMTVLKNVNVVLNTTDGSDITKRKRENGSISAQVVRSDRNEE